MFIYVSKNEYRVTTLRIAIYTQIAQLYLSSITVVAERRRSDELIFKFVYSALLCVQFLYRC